MVTKLKLSFFSACPQQDVGCFWTVLHGIIPCDKWVSERICLEFVQALSVHMCLQVCVVWLQCRCVKLSRLHVVIRFEDELPHIIGYVQAVLTAGNCPCVSSIGLQPLKLHSSLC